ncbi:DUF4256 domain-containing protein [Abyssicoccus albus]|uniref:DUF4256 domain-containing protein n=1 Tax=Abyssicoccus albus TaxID=1817405 RepID=UPI00097E2D00|nr:DUF4256 domain-containing protein [Abyssicoccus albus]AQL55486.1 hypothetical protein BVH56_00260 [Abyssicoccus albus]
MTHEELIALIEKRFNKTSHTRTDKSFDDIKEKLLQSDKLDTLIQMEETKGEVDFVWEDGDTLVFADCALQSPKGRVKYCYDREALEGRKKYPPENDIISVANNMGIELCDEQLYRKLQEVAGPFDTKTSSWIKTPDDVRSLGGALFGDYRYGRVFIYHNGADSYYSSRAFRGFVKV